MGLFKCCGNCGKTWRNRDAFIDDPEVEIIGFQPNAEKPEDGFFLFNHDLPTASCGSTLADRVCRYIDLCPPEALRYVAHPGPVVCKGYCLRADALEHCHEPCSNAFARSILQAIRQRHYAALARGAGGEVRSSVA